MGTYGKALDAEFWKHVRENDAFAGHLADLHQRWKKYCAVPLAEPSYSDIKRYYTHGDRAAYEQKVFPRHDCLNTSVLLSLIYPEEPKYLEKVSNCIFDICNQYFWSLPGHQSALDTFNPLHIDLFSAETGANLAETYVLLKDRLDPLLLRRIREEVRRRILEPFLQKTFRWESYISNWAAVCTCGVAISIMNLFPEEAAALIPRFESSIDHFLDSYGNDGFCLEGPSYWDYGFSFFTIYAERLRSFAGIDRFRDPKVERIASFLQKIYLDDHAAVSFSDAALLPKYNPGIQHFLHKEYPNTVTIPPAQYICYCLPLNRRLNCHLRSFIWFDPGHQTTDRCGVHYGEDAQWLIARKEGFGFAAKAGHNDEPHNHNDVGSFIFVKNGRQVLTDPGCPPYSREYFQSDHRYQFLQSSSRGHNVPIVNGQYQQPGQQFAATDVSWDGVVFSMDLAGTYDVEGLSSLQRSFRLTDSGVRLTDRIEGTVPITERFVSHERPTIEPGIIRWADTEMIFSRTLLPIVTTETVTKNHTLYLVDIPLPPNSSEFTAEIR